MAMIFFLKMLCDLSLYYMFADPIAGYFGGGQLMACMILQCVIYALSRMVKNRFLRFVTLIPLGLCFILGLSSLADTMEEAFSVKGISDYRKTVSRFGKELADDLLQGCPMTRDNKLFDADWDQKYLHGEH